MKSDVVMLAPGRFESPYLYILKRWRQVQHIVNKSWSTWHKKFLGSLLFERQKWNTNTKKFQVGDIVLLKEEQQLRNS